jgi:hypothetical protein
MTQIYDKFCAAKGDAYTLWVLSSILLYKDVHYIFSVLKWASHRPTMLHPQVVDGGDKLIWKTTVNVLNKQSHAAKNGWYSNLGQTHRSGTQELNGWILQKLTVGLGGGSK